MSSDNDRFQLPEDERTDQTGLVVSFSPNYKYNGEKTIYRCNVIVNGKHSYNNVLLCPFTGVIDMVQFKHSYKNKPLKMREIYVEVLRPFDETPQKEEVFEDWKV